jgi:hypothetical protein
MSTVEGETGSVNAVRSNPILLWDVNPSEVDLLGFDAVVAPMVAAVSMSDLDPLTIGIHGPWGGGKSTILLVSRDKCPLLKAPSRCVGHPTTR